MIRPAKKGTEATTAVEQALLEIGTEEIPASYLPPALSFMQTFSEDFLKSKRLAFAAVTTLGSPRRLAMIISGLPQKSEAVVEDVLGPSLRAAKDANGQWTQAGKGFAEAHGVSVEALQIRNTKKGDYVCAVMKHEGAKSEIVLKELIAELIPAIPFPKKMIWNATKFKFARPIRNIVAVYGTKVLASSLAGVKTSNKTFGLSHQSTQKIVVNAHNYNTALKNHCILVDPETRKKTILQAANQLAGRIKGQLKADENLLEEIVWLVEHPVAILGNFDPEFLELPQEVLMTCMKKHQKFFSILDQKGKLLPHFVAIRNGISEHQELVRKGYEKVLAARLVDAKFFFSEDMKKPLEFYVKKSGEITIQEKLGSISDKTKRAKKIAQLLMDELASALSPENGSPDRAAVDRAIDLAKFDLTTSMVYEFPELQGIMGELYAARRGENPKACMAIREHYYPLSNQGELPGQFESCVVAAADKIDGLSGNFLIGLIPSGSADPFGSRRQATGIARILLANRWPLALKKLVQFSLEQFDLSLCGKSTSERDAVAGVVLDFLTERFQLWLEDSGYAADEISAVTKNALDPDCRNLVLTNLQDKISAVHSLRSHPDFEAIAVAFKRTSNILKQSKAKSIPTGRELFSESLLREPEERELHSVLAQASEKTQSLIEGKSYQAALQELVVIRKPLDQFFEKVLVMDPDQEVCKNRLSLLTILETTFKQIADFSLIQNHA